MNSLSKSLKAKILLVLISVFAMLILLTTLIIQRNEKAMVLDLAIDKTEQVARTFFDNINATMLSGTYKQNSEVLRKKLLTSEGILKVKIIRADAVKTVFGAGKSYKIIEDQLDRKAFKSKEPLITTLDKSGKRSVSVIIPMFASKNYKGTNCMTCHVTNEGDLLGTVRVDYSLEKLDEKIDANLWQLSIANIVVILIGLFIITWYIGRVVLNPLVNIRNIMTSNAENQDLTQTIKIDSEDEIGQVAKAFNQLLSHFSKSLQQVSETANQLTVTSKAISNSAIETSSAATQQDQETDSVTTAIQQLEQSAEQMSNNANDIALSSSQADDDATRGKATTSQAIEGILELARSIDDASQVIVSLDQQSEGIGSVLDVIKAIAEQTNLLALNAAIEAARAGDQGRGFAVVADEVRTLATRSHDSTQEIERIIEQLQAGAKQAVLAMNQAKTKAERRQGEVESADLSLQTIAERVSDINEKNERMNLTVQHQSELTRTVQENILNINQLSESTVKDAKLTSQQSDEIVNLARRLTELINQFKF